MGYENHALFIASFMVVDVVIGILTDTDILPFSWWKLFASYILKRFSSIVVSSILGPKNIISLILLPLATVRNKWQLSALVCKIRS